MDFLLDNKFTRFMGEPYIFWPLVIIFVLLLIGFFVMRKMRPRDDDDE